MRRVALAVVIATGLSLGSAGCYTGVHGRLYVDPIATAITVAAIVNAVSTPPPMAVNVEYYDVGYNPGHCWVNGRYVYSNNAWAWRAGYWQDDRPGYYWVQGSWQPRDNQYVWVDGYWAEPRTGYVYVDGYWDYRDNGYAWVDGRWEVERPGYVFVGGSWSTAGGRRVWSQGGWQRDDGRVEWARYRARGGVQVRDHRH
jgi:YXWGXW repeat-containing protein